MGNVAVAGERAGSDELDELCLLDLSETGPEDGDGEDDSQDEGDEGEGIQPDEMPQG
jgi:hypothetical protein